MADDDLHFGPAPTVKKPDATDDPNLHFGAPGVGPAPSTKSAPAPKTSSERKFLDDDNPDNKDENWGKLGESVIAHVPSGIVGIPAALRDTMRTVGAAVTANTGDPRTTQQVLDDRTKEREAKGEHDQFPSEEEVYKKWVDPLIGDYKPKTQTGRLVHATASGAIPGAIMGPGGIIRGAIAGGAGGLASQGAAELLPDSPVAPIIAGAAGGVGGAGIAKGVGKAAEGVKNVTLGRSPTADKIVRDYQEHPETKAEQAAIPGKQAEAEIVPMLRGVESDVKSTAVSDNFARRRDALLKQHDDTSIDAPHLNESGDAAQAHLAQKHAEAKQLLDKLEGSIDPEGIMTMRQDAVKDLGAQHIAETESRPYQARSELADKYMATAAKLPAVMKFRDMIDFDRSLSAAQSQAKRLGDGVGYAKLTQLKAAVKQSYKEAIDKQHATEQGLVAKGHMAEEDTLAYRQRQHQAATNGSADGGLDAAGASGSARDSAGAGAVDATGTQGVRGNADARQPGADSLSGNAELAPNFDPEAAKRLELFNQGYGKVKDTFGGDTPTGKVMAAPLGADAAGKAFVAGPKGYDIAKAVVSAGGDESVAHMKQIAAGNLQAELKGKPLDQVTLDKWKAKNADALRAIDEKSPGFSDQFNDHAQAGQAVREYEKSTAAKLIDKDPEDVVNHVGSLMKRGDSTMMRQLMEQAKAADGGVDGGPAVAGLRRAAAQHLENDFNARGSNGILDTLKKHRNMLDATFDPAHVKKLADLAEKIEQSATAQTLERTKQLRGQPGRQEQLDTQLKAAMGKDHAGGGHSIMAVLWYEGVQQALAGNFHHIPGLLGMGVARHLIGKARTGIHESANAKLAKLVTEGLNNPEVGKLMAERATTANGQPNMWALHGLQQIMQGSAQGEQNEQRQAHAAGGSVFDHRAAAKHMIGMVDKARKTEATHTKPLLQASDTVIANALAMANRRG